MALLVIGIVIVIVGIILLLVGAIGGAWKMFKDLKDAPQHGGGLLEDATKFIDKATTFFKALKDAPIWLVLVFLGFLLVIVGSVVATKGAEAQSTATQKATASS